MKAKTVLSAVSLAAMVAASISTVAFADIGRQGGRGMQVPFNFEEMDADKDGKVTEAEIAVYRAAKIAEIDTDKDGKISAAELTAAHDKLAEARANRRAERMITRLDGNNDGVLSVEEMAQMGNQNGRMFDRIDTDGDGAISKAEADMAKDRMANREDEKGRKGKYRRGHDNN